MLALSARFPGFDPLRWPKTSTRMVFLLATVLVVGRRRLSGVVAVVAVLTVAAPSASAQVSTEVSYRYGFCHQLERYGKAVNEWWPATAFGSDQSERVLASEVRKTRLAAWKAIKREDYKPGVSSFAREWRKQHYGRNSRPSRSWGSAARSADEFLMRNCYPLSPFAAPPRNLISR